MIEDQPRYSTGTAALANSNLFSWPDVPQRICYVGKRPLGSEGNVDMTDTAQRKCRRSRLAAVVEPMCRAKTNMKERKENGASYLTKLN